MPQPIRDPAGHSFGQPPIEEIEPALSSVAFRWGIDLFDHGFYWEAHESWEPLWRSATQDDSRWFLLKGLILLAASGVKIRERKLSAAKRHGDRSAHLFRVAEAMNPSCIVVLGTSLAELARCAENIPGLGSKARRSPFAAPEAVFDVMFAKPVVT